MRGQGWFLASDDHKSPFAIPGSHRLRPPDGRQVLKNSLTNSGAEVAELLKPFQHLADPVEFRLSVKPALFLVGLIRPTQGAFRIDYADNELAVGFQDPRCLD
jgi:hypothetical protein